MQVSRFSDGGFVIHKARVSHSVCLYSAWFDANGNLLGAEGFDRSRRARPVATGGPVWQNLANLGSVWKGEGMTDGYGARYF